MEISENVEACGARKRFTSVCGRDTDWGAGSGVHCLSKAGGEPSRRLGEGGSEDQVRIIYFLASLDLNSFKLQILVISSEGRLFSPQTSPGIFRG